MLLKIMNANNHIISRLVQEGGWVSLDLGVTPDNVNQVTKIRMALEKTDMIIATAGSSVLEYAVVDLLAKFLSKYLMILKNM